MTAAGGPQALVVEDRPFVALVICDVLREVGYAGLCAFDSSEAQKLLDSSTDVRLAVVEAELDGGRAGLEFVRRIARQRPEVPIVVTVSGGEVAANELPNGARVLRKPFASDDLRALVGGMSLLQEA